MKLRKAPLLLTVIFLLQSANACGGEKDVIFKFKKGFEPRRSEHANFVIAYPQRAVKYSKVWTVLRASARSKVTRLRRIYRNQNNPQERQPNRHDDPKGFRRVIKFRVKPVYSTAEVCEQLKLTGAVEYCHGDIQAVFNALPNDTYIDPNQTGQWVEMATNVPMLWGLKMIKALEAWELPYCPGGCKGQGVTIIINDSGVDLTHPDIQDNIYINQNEIINNGIDDDHNGYIDDISGWDFYNSSNLTLDESGHGSHLAGTAAAASGNGIGIAGVAPSANVLALKQSGRDGVGYTSSMAEGIVYAANLLDADGNGQIDKPAVMNNSWSIRLSNGSCPDNPTLKSAVEYAADKGIIMVFSAGNSNTIFDCMPQNMPEVITVGAVRSDGGRASYSNYGSLVTVAAPGGTTTRNILSLLAKDSAFETEPGITVVGSGSYKYAMTNGTSMAAPHISGAVALLLQRWNPTRLHFSQVKALMVEGADPLTTPSPKPIGGLINAKKLLEITSLPAAVIPVRTTPTPEPSPTIVVPTPLSTSVPTSAATPGQSFYSIGGIFMGKGNSGLKKQDLKKFLTLKPKILITGGSLGKGQFFKVNKKLSWAANLAAANYKVSVISGKDKTILSKPYVLELNRNVSNINFHVTIRKNKVKLLKATSKP